MRNRRIMMQMAGLAPTPYERREMRLMRQINRYAQELQQREMLLTAIQRRERGDADTRAMPYAKDSKNA